MIEKIMLMTALILALAVSAQAKVELSKEGVRVADLYQYCTQPEFEHLCIGFVSGALQMFTALNMMVKDETEGKLTLACVDENLKVNDLIKWMLDHQKTMMEKSSDLSAVGLILAVLSKFECKHDLEGACLTRIHKGR